MLGLFLNIATIPLLVRSLRAMLQNLDRRKVETFDARNLLRAYALCLTWSPMEVMISTTIDFTGVRYYEVALFLLIINDEDGADRLGNTNCFVSQQSIG
ncbi:hypothetical protein [Geobacillus thermodenitrificans]|uniref:Uncharacterized protein n=1 Tax=Geobacillus thermodenitrificans (strain NG80-2) TaxID=420246 RepID=A4IPQ5_GEOTN|nr:hypothetical protein [Geobacillus thermodenitrificans]ABO67309.1 hypothetical protein GTNG_1954 [Geobacillus thermodenitrificans NG80-2]